MQHVYVQGASRRCGLIPASLRSHRLRVQCAAAPEPNEAERPSSSKGKSFSGERRRRGRPAHLRSPDDSPLRDGNRDRLMGLLTERAAKTLAYYLIETNHNIHHWINRFIKDHPIPRDGNWDDVSGDTFLRTLLSMPIEEAMPWGRDPVFHNTSASDVDPRSIAQRIMEIRAQLANEFIQDLQQVAEENKLLQLETLQASLLSTEDAIADGSAAARQYDRMGAGEARGGGAASTTGRAAADAADAARAKAKRSKKSVLPPQPTPSNWRLRLEVEAQVYAPDESAAPDGTAPGPVGPPGSATGIPDSVMTGLISSTYVPPTTPPAVPAAAASPPPPESSPAAVARPPPPLHPEVAEMLPLIRSSPSALTPDIAQMLASLAVLSDGQLHPDIVDALSAAVNAGAKLHPEMAELLRFDSPAASGTPPPAAAAAAAATAATVPVAPAPTALVKSTPPLGQVSKPPVPPEAAAAAVAAAAATAPVAAPQVVEVPKAEEPEEEDSITALQNDTCLHSDDD